MRAAQSAGSQAERLAREHEVCSAREAGLAAERDRVAQRCAELAVQLETASGKELERLRLEEAAAALAERNVAAGEEKELMLTRCAELAEARAERAEAALAAEREAHDRLRARLASDAESREAELDAACALAESSQCEAADLRVRLEAAERAQGALEGELQRAQQPWVAAAKGRGQEQLQEPLQEQPQEQPQEQSQEQPQEQPQEKLHEEQGPLSRLLALERGLSEERLAHCATAESAASLSAALTAALGKLHQAEEHLVERAAAMERDLADERAARSSTAESAASLSAALTEALVRLDQAEEESGERAAAAVAEAQLAALQERAARDKAQLKRRHAEQSKQLMSEVEGVERAAAAAQASAKASRAAQEQELGALRDRCERAEAALEGQRAEAARRADQLERAVDRCVRAEAALEGQRVEAARQATQLECAVDRCSALESNLGAAGRRRISYRDETALTASLAALLAAAARGGR
jgi:hypothetical protein